MIAFLLIDRRCMEPMPPDRAARSAIPARVSMLMVSTIVKNCPAKSALDAQQLIQVEHILGEAAEDPGEPFVQTREKPMLP
jgi:hypothetical protein